MATDFGGSRTRMYQKKRNNHRVTETISFVDFETRQVSTESKKVSI